MFFIYSIFTFPTTILKSPTFGLAYLVGRLAYLLLASTPSPIFATIRSNSMHVFQFALIET
jgi:hypothetical protein